jgi:hypothetical protein
MSKRGILQLQGEGVSKQELNVILAQMSERLNQLEGKSGAVPRTDPLHITGGRGANFRVGNYAINRYGDDLEKVGLATGAYLDPSGTWYATQTVASIMEMDNTKNFKFYWDDGLTPGKPFVPTLEFTQPL